MKATAISGLLALCFTIPALAGDVTPIPQLQAFAALVGPTWVGEFPGGTVIDEQEFEWVFGGRFLRNVHRVINADGAVVYEGETIYAWDPKQETIVWWYWNATGGHIVGTMAKTTEGWMFEGVNHAPPPQPDKVRGLFRLRSEREWQSVQYFPSEGGWKERFTITFRPKESLTLPAENPGEDERRHD